MSDNDHLSALAEIAAEHSRTIMARSGQLPLASYIMTPDGVQMLVAGATDELNKRMFAAITRVCGAKHKATATAVVMETWTTTRVTDEGRAQTAGDGVSGFSGTQHPRGVEKVLIITGDGERQELREYLIERHHKDMVQLHHAETMRYEGEGRLTGLLTNLHARPEEQRTYEFRSMTELLEEMGVLDGVPVSEIRNEGRAN